MAEDQATAKDFPKYAIFRGKKYRVMYYVAKASLVVCQNALRRTGASHEAARQDRYRLG